MNTFTNANVDILPNIEDVNYKPIDPNHFKVIIINFSLLYFAIIIGSIAISFTDDSGEFSLLKTVLLVSVAFVVLLVYQKISFSKRLYAMREKDITYKHGLLFESTTSVPFTRIQHVKIDSSPISRLFNLSTISFYTAGNSSDDLKIRGLKKEEAIKIQEYIHQHING